MGKNALVSGASSGIGRGIALALGRRNINVALAGRRTERLAEVADELSNLQVRTCVVETDLSCMTDRSLLIDEVSTRLGAIDILVHCAGILNPGAIDELIVAPADAIAVNLLAPIELTRQALPDLAVANGAVVFVVSTAGRVPFPYASIYSGTKHGLVGFAEALRFELEARGIHLLVAYPPMTDTEMTQPMSQATGFSTKRLARPDQVGEAIVRALLRRQRVHWGSWQDRALDALQRHIPWFVYWVLRANRRKFRAMLSPPDKEPGEGD